MMSSVTRSGEILNSRVSGGTVKRVTVAVLLSGLIALLTLGLAGCGSSSSAPPSIGVALTPSGTKSIDQAQTVSITAAVANDSKSAGVTWTVSGTNGSQGTLTNTSTTLATYNTPVSVTSAFTATVTATSVTDTTKSAVLKINVSPLPSITTTSLAAATAGTAYSATLVEAGGTSPFTWTVSPATLPAGLSLNSSTGVIGGIPTGGGSGSFTFKVTDASGNSASSQPIPITVGAAPQLAITTTTLPGATIGTPYSATVTATGGVPFYTWSLSSNPSWLSINPSTGALSGTPTGTSGSTANFTVKVTDSQTPTANSQSTGLSIVISVATLKITTTSLPAATAGTEYSATVSATGGVPAYTWSLSGNPSWLAINPSTGALSGTAPGTAGTTPTFSVVVTDSETPTQESTANFTITINAAQACTSTNNNLLSGNYALVLNGWKNSATTATSFLGSFVADGKGNISAGLMDIADQNDSTPQTGGTFTGTYCVGSNNLATVTLTPAGGTPGTFEAALDASDGNGHIMGYDKSGLLASGLLRKQTTSAFKTGAITGNYAFGLVGADNSGSAKRFAVAGEFNSDGSGNLSGESDSDDNGTVQSQQTFGASNFSVASSGAQAGRGTATITGITNRDINFVFYVVSASEMLMMAVDTGRPPMIMAGQVLQQSSNLTDASLNGNGVLGTQALDTGNTPATADVQVGLINGNGSGAFTATIDENDGGTLNDGLGEPASLAGSYSVEPSSGRVTLSNVTGCPGGCGLHNPVFYLVGLNQAFVVDTGGKVSFGTITPQTGSDFSKSSLSGNFLGGSQPPVSWSVDTEVDYINLNDGTVTGTSDDDGSGGPSAGGAINATYVVSSNGRVVASQGGVQQEILYIISTSQLVGMDAGSDNTNPSLTDFHK